MSDTPKTDAEDNRLADYDWDEGYGELLGFARRQELEISTLRDGLTLIANGGEAADSIARLTLREASAHQTCPTPPNS